MAFWGDELQPVGEVGFGVGFGLAMLFDDLAGKGYEASGFGRVGGGV